MASLNQVIKGLEILSKYDSKNGDSHNICAEHDIIYAGPGVEVSEEDKKILDDLGWHWDSSADSWARFV